jgi:hypothetical protein
MFLTLRHAESAPRVADLEKQDAECRNFDAGNRKGVAENGNCEVGNEEGETEGLKGGGGVEDFEEED